MAHYAQVIDNIVQTVLVVDKDEDAALIEPHLNNGGKLIKVSFNTRNGVHYGADGKPDGGEALRFNYPQAGYYYDEVRDAFYPSKDKPADTMYLCNQSLAFKQPLENKAIRASTGMPQGPKHKVYLTPGGFSMFGPITLDNLSRSLNIEFVNDLAQAKLALPMTDQETLLFADRPEFDGLRPMTSRQLLDITDRLAQQRLGLPVLPAWRGRTKEEVEALGDQPLFVKRQRTLAKDRHPMAYTSWANAQAFLDAVDDSFWELQAAPDALYGEFIFQPQIKHPFSGLDLRIAVNQDSETHVWCESMMTYDAVDVLGKWVPFAGDCTKEKEDVARVVKEQGLKAGVHLLQYAWYNDQWTLMDWNSRFTGVHVSLFPSVYPVLNDAFSWMLGLPLYHEADNLYWEQRSYRDLGLGRSVEGLVGESGLFARWVGDKLHRVAGIGTSKREVEERYARFDHLLTQRPVKS